jgi:hypothetical protein
MAWTDSSSASSCSAASSFGSVVIDDTFFS